MEGLASVRRIVSFFVGRLLHVGLRSHARFLYRSKIMTVAYRETGLIEFEPDLLG